jgi:3'-5' exonuclease
MIQELRDIVFLDIETVAQHHNFDSLDERLKVQWSRKASFLKKDPGQTDQSAYQEKAGIYAEFGKIVCIAVGKFAENESGDLVLRTKAYCSHDESELLTEFKAMVEKLDAGTVKFCAHNGKEFDYPYLCRRLLVNHLGIPAALNLMGKRPWEVQHLDTLEMWKFGDYKHYTSLDLLAAIFNIPSSKLDMDGSQVNAVYHIDHNLVKIKDYCLRDIVVLSQLYLKLKSISLNGDFIVVGNE